MGQLTGREVSKEKIFWTLVALSAGDERPIRVIDVEDGFVADVIFSGKLISLVWPLTRLT